MTEHRRPAHVMLYYERQCRNCKNTLRALVHDYGEVRNLEDIDEKFGSHDFPVLPIKCSACGQEDWPEYMVLCEASNNNVIARIKIGSHELPVVGGSAPYAVVRSEEEQAELERGLAKIKDHFAEHEEEFWESYTKWALERWDEALKSLSTAEWVAAYNELGIEVAPFSSSAAYRKDAASRFKGDERVKLWRAANKWLVYNELLWVPIDAWPIEEYVTRYGKERITWLLLNIPLPEELERFRTEKIAAVVPRKQSGPQAALWERIRQLGDELAKQRRRAENLSRQLAEERAEKARLEAELAAARKEIEHLKESARNQPSVRSIEDITRISRLKALIAELRNEVASLRKRLQAYETEDEVVEDTAQEPPPVSIPPEERVDVFEYMSDKTIAAYGRLDETYNEGPTVRWHDGDRWDSDAEKMARESDVLVILTRLCSHEVMWAAKEYAADIGKPIAFSRGSGLESVVYEAYKSYTQKR